MHDCDGRDNSSSIKARLFSLTQLKEPSIYLENKNITTWQR